MKLYILSLVDIENFGYYSPNPQVFYNREEAVKAMRRDYSLYCAQYSIDTPFACSMEHSFYPNLGTAHIANKAYWTISEVNIGEPETEDTEVKLKEYTFRFHRHAWTDITVEASDEEEAEMLANDKYNEGDDDDSDEDFENTDCENITGWDDEEEEEEEDDDD